MIDSVALGSRREFVLTIMDGRGSYPRTHFRSADAVYVATPDLVYTVAPCEAPNEFGFSEIAWADVGEIRLWGALAFSIPEGRGFYHFRPLRRSTLCLRAPQHGLLQRIAEKVAASESPQSYKLHWVEPRQEEIASLYEGLRRSDSVVLRGVACYLKAHLLWAADAVLFMEEMAINLHLSLEAGLSVLRRRLSANANRAVSFDAVHDFVARTFSYGEALVDFWRDRRDDRNLLLHPDSNDGPHAFAPMCADDVLELFDPMLSLYRFILIGETRPTDL